MPREACIGERRLQLGTHRPVAHQREAEGDLTPPQHRVHLHQVGQILFSDQPADQQEQRRAVGGERGGPKGGVPLFGREARGVDPPRPQLGAPDSVLRQFADQRAGRDVDAPAAPVEAPHQRPPQFLQPPDPVEAEVGDEVGVKGGDYRHPTRAGPALRPHRHGGGADQVHQVGPPVVQLRANAVPEGDADPVVGVGWEVDVADRAHPCAPAHLRPWRKGREDAKVDVVRLQGSKQLRQGPRHPVHMGKQAFGEVGDPHGARI